MRIGVVGTHGVGKSTLVNALSKMHNIPAIDEQIRLTVNKYNTLGYNTPDEMVGSTWYNDMVLDTMISQINLEKQYGNSFVSDRTLLDYYIYCSRLSKDADSILILMKAAIIDYYCKNYDLILYVPILFDLIGDCYRNTDVSFQKQIDNDFRMHLNYNKNVYIIQETNFDRRLQECTNIIIKSS